MYHSNSPCTVVSKTVRDATKNHVLANPTNDTCTSVDVLSDINIVDTVLIGEDPWPWSSHHCGNQVLFCFVLMVLYLGSLIVLWLVLSHSWYPVDLILSHEIHHNLHQ